jgi:hypothetical protein
VASFRQVSGENEDTPKGTSELEHSEPKYPQTLSDRRRDQILKGLLSGREMGFIHLRGTRAYIEKCRI